MRIVINAVSAKMGGALAYLRNFLPTLAAADRENEYIVFMHSSFRSEFDGIAPNIRVESCGAAEQSEMRRLVFDQWTLRRFASNARADAIFSTANFGVLRPPAPQVTSVRNPVYFSRQYYSHVRDVEGRLAAARVAARRRLVALSCASSSVVVTPTAAMRDMLLDWDSAEPAKCVVINHGFDTERFLSMRPKPDARIDAALVKRGEALLFYPSLYGKHKNFDSLVRGVARLSKRGVEARLLLTCDLDNPRDPYQRRTRALLAGENIESRVSFLGTVPYACMPRIYAAADVVLWPTFAESFGHPLLEAMASRRPIASSDIAVNREMARDAAVYFAPFDPDSFADAVESALRPATADRLVREGLRRVGDFSWRRHVDAFVQVFEELSAKGKDML